ncbi:MAG: crossover junction endodeoxyribonuclease RuvC [Gemmatales bacterium]|nr:crossover junction endodeoxyribonuclease RuvC [Gemmatales bacterium]
MRILGLDPGLHITGYAILECSPRAEGVSLPVKRAEGVSLLARRAEGVSLPVRRAEGVSLPVNQADALTPPIPSLLEAGILRSAGRTLPDRLRSLHDGLDEVMQQFQPTILVVEELFAHYAHPRTAVLMAHARGVLLLAAARREVPCLSYTATQIKKVIAGSGRAKKDEIQRTMVQELGLGYLPDPPDVADALAAALCHYHLCLRKAS